MRVHQQLNIPIEKRTNCERTQPFVIGLDSKGELVWVSVEMPRWQMEMIRVTYRGDFRAFWTARALSEQFGWELDVPSMELKTDKSWAKKTTKALQGD